MEATGFRDDAGLLVTAAGTALAAGFSWFLNSPLLGVVSGVLLGTGLTMLTQSRWQKRLWKRELGLKNIDNIYAPVYRELNTALATIQATNVSTGYHVLPYQEWTKISSDYTFHFIDEPLRGQLEKLYTLIGRVNRLRGETIERVNNVIRGEASQIFGGDVQVLQYNVKTGPNSKSAISLANALLFNTHPSEVLKTFPGAGSPPHFTVSLGNQTDPGGGVPVSEYDDAMALFKFDKFFQAASKRVESDPLCRELKRTTQEIRTQAVEVLQSLLQLIKEPWSS